MEFTYPTPTTVDTFYTDANGSLVTPEKLPYGQGYSIVEVQSPYGYVLVSSAFSKLTSTFCLSLTKELAVSVTATFCPA